MNFIYSQKFKKEMAVIHPGEYYVSDQHIVHTLLGTCVSVVFYHAPKRIGGMNHYMLPHGSKEGEGSGRYGVFAMELLLNEFQKLGINRRSLVAKVFGGGKVLDALKHDGKPHVGTQNVEFVLEYLDREGIPIAAQDLGGEGGRKIYFFPWTGKVLVSRIRKTQAILVSEDQYEQTLDKEPKESKIILFDD